MRLADSPFRDHLCQGQQLAHGNLLWSPMESILAEHLATRQPARQVAADPGRLDVVVLSTLRVAFLETAAHTIPGRNRPSR